MITIYTPKIAQGEIIHYTSNLNDQHYIHPEVIAPLRIGTFLCNSQGDPSLLVIGKHYNYSQDTLASYTLTCKALHDLQEVKEQYSPKYKGYSIAWITLSDSSSIGKRTDTSGPLIGSILQKSFDISVERGFVIPDDPQRLEHLLLDLSLFQRFNCIITTGGTGVAPRDITPEVMEKIIQRPLYGFELAMMQASMCR